MNYTPLVLPKKNNINPLVLGGVVLFLLFFLVSALIIKSKQNISPTSTTNPLTTSSNNIPSKYSLDTDADTIPDTLETELSLDPKISEFDRCQPENCGASEKTNAQATTNNILLIIDASGSMGLNVGDKTKMDLAKEAIRNFLNSVSNNVNVGIMVYGNKGSNLINDKPLSCTSAEVIAPIGSVSATTVDQYLSQIQPVGWTPIGLAIKQGVNAFAGKEGQKNQMIIVTDGGETCDTNPAQEALLAKQSSLEIQVDVIGFAVNLSEQSSLQTISTNGGGLFSLASNADQLVSQIKASRANFDKFQENAKCTTDSYNKSVQCLQDVNQKVFAYLQDKLISLRGSENQQMSNLRTTISTAYNKKINDLQEEQNTLIKSNQQQLLK